MRGAVLLTGLLAIAGTGGCKQVLGIDTDVVVVDAVPRADGTVDDPCGKWEPALFRPCDLTPHPSLEVPAGEYTWTTEPNGNTKILAAGGQPLFASTDATLRNDGTVLALAYVERLIVDEGAHVRIVGDVPLVIGAAGSIDIRGTLDVGSHLVAGDDERKDGAGALETAGCTATAGETVQPSTGGSGGGAGGAFASNGTKGADGIGGAGSGGIGADASNGVPKPRSLRAGCGGGAGGGGITSMLDASLPGGALALMTYGKLTVSSGAVISASGGGGESALIGRRGGGSGGGSGGMLWLEGTEVIVEGSLTATGGGGGAGDGAMSDETPPTDGHDGTTDGSRATGGTPGGSCTSRGGNGGSRDSDAESGVRETGECTAGGGGGGGTVGVIFIDGTTVDADDAHVIAPPYVPSGVN